MNYDNSPFVLFLMLFLLFALFTNPWALSTIKVRFYKTIYNSPTWIRNIFFRERNED